MSTTVRKKAIDAIWSALEPRLPVPRRHPLGCHRRRTPDRACFERIVLKMVTGCSWEDAALGLCTSRVLRDRRDEWVAAGVFSDVFDEALSGRDKVVGSRLDRLLVDGSQAKAPCGGEGVGPNPTDRGKGGWKRSVGTDAHGIPLGFVVSGANMHDSKLFARTLADIQDRGWLETGMCAHLDRGYDYPRVDEVVEQFGLTAEIVRRRAPSKRRAPAQHVSLGARWPVERFHAWINNAFGQLRRSTDRKNRHRYEWLALASTIIITSRLLRLYHRHSVPPDTARRNQPQPAW